MHSRRLSTALFLVVFVLLTGFLAGCGGGDQSSNGAQGNGSSGEAKKQGGEAAKKQGSQAPKREVSATKVALGTVKGANVEGKSRRIVLKPTSEKQGKKPIRFRITKQAKITLDDKKAELTDIKEGQQAQITYVVINEHNRAREVSLISDGGATSGADEKSD